MKDLKEVIVENGIEYRLAENGCYYPVIGRILVLGSMLV